MKLVTFASEQGSRVGAVTPGGLVDLTGAGLPGSMKAFLQAGPETWQRAAQIAAATSQPAPLDGARLLAPIPDPGKIVAIGLNYLDHCREQNVPVPERPMVFAKFPTAINGPGQPICWDPALTAQVDFEVELGVVIGRRARRVSEAEALDCVFGYTVLNDVSARDLQFGDRQWVRGKSLDTFCPIGPWIVTTDELPDPQALRLRTVVNGQVMQDSSTAEMVFGVRHLVAVLSQAFTLEPGDLIATGTPDGVGVFRKPQVFLQDGDRVVCEIEGIGTLENICRTDAAPATH